MTTQSRGIGHLVHRHHELSRGGALNALEVLELNTGRRVQSGLEVATEFRLVFRGECEVADVSDCLASFWAAWAHDRPGAAITVAAATAEVDKSPARKRAREFTRKITVTSSSPGIGRRKGGAS